METLFTNSEVLVETNGSNEIFVLNKRTGVNLRISPKFNLTQITCEDHLMLPGSINGLRCIDAFPSPTMKKQNENNWIP